MKKLFIIASITLLPIVVSASSPEECLAYGYSDQKMNNGSENVMGDDMTLVERIKARLKSEGISPRQEGVIITTERGTITINGDIPEERKKRIMDTLKKIEGVRNVQMSRMNQSSQIESRPSRGSQNLQNYDNKGPYQPQPKAYQELAFGDQRYGDQRYGDQRYDQQDQRYPTRFQDQYPDQRDQRFADRFGDQQPQLSDQQIAQKIEEALKNNWLKRNYENVNIRVFRGDVTLDGEVSSQDQLADIEDRLQRIEGIRQLRNQIRVNPRSSDGYMQDRRTDMQDRRSDMDRRGDRGPLAINEKTPTTHQQKQQMKTNPEDDRISRQIAEKIRDARGSENISYEVVNKEVILYGNIPSEDQLNDIQNRIRQINGVQRIKNMVKIKANNSYLRK